MSEFGEAEGVLDLRVESMTFEAEGVVSLTLVDLDLGWLPEWSPGAHIDLRLPPCVRQYSLCGDPADRQHYRVAVLREQHSRGGSSYVHGELRPGDIVEIGGPRNHFELSPAKKYLFIAGGIGITPILTMVDRVQAAGADWQLVYGGRSHGSMAFRDKLAAHGDAVSFVAVDEEGPLDLESLLSLPAEGLEVYCCGPSGMLDAVETICARQPGIVLHLERFKPKDLSALGSHPVEVMCQRSNLMIHVPADMSILDCLEKSGIDVANACREGVCGSCEVAVIEGIPEHRDSLRTGDMLDDVSSLLVCVSRAKTTQLVLDV